MPKKLEEKLNHELSTNPKYKNLSEDRKNAIKYSVMRKTGWTPSKSDADTAKEILPNIRESLDASETPLEAWLLHWLYMQL